MSRYAQAPKARSNEDKRNAMFLSLYQRSIKSLRALTPDMLIAQYGVDRKTAQYELMIAVQKRASEQ